MALAGQRAVTRAAGELGTNQDGSIALSAVLVIISGTLLLTVRLVTGRGPAFHPNSGT